MPKSHSENQAAYIARKKKIAKGLIPITLWCYPATITLVRWGVRAKLALAKSKDTRDNLEDILRELQKYGE